MSIIRDFSDDGARSGTDEEPLFNDDGLVGTGGKDEDGNEPLPTFLGDGPPWSSQPSADEPRLSGGPSEIRHR